MARCSFVKKLMTYCPRIHDTQTSCFKSDGTLATWAHATFNGIAQGLVSIFISSTCLLGADAKATAGLVRMIWYLYGLMFVAGAIGITFSQHYLFPDMPVEGQYFNLGMWFIGSSLSMKAMTGALPFMKK